MSPYWFYSHENVTYGPISEEEIKERAARGMFAGSDFVWREGGGEACQANTVFDFPPPAPVVPDWLADVAEAEAKAARAAPVAGTETPDWLEDLSLWIALEQLTPESAPEKPKIEIAPAAPSATMPDWLQGWLTPEAPTPSTPPPAAPAPPLATPIAPPPKPPPVAPSPPLATPIAPSPKPPTAAPAPPLATPVAAPPKSRPAAPPPPLATPVSPPPKQSPVAPPVAPPAVSAPITPPAKPPAAPPSPEPTLADRVREATGFDADTGQIVDPVKFALWKQQQNKPSAADKPGVSNATLFEAFRKGRTAIEAWVDAEENRMAIMHGEIDVIKRTTQVQAILQQYANFGKDLPDKLLRHLEFMVENRRKYYNAIAGRR